MQTLEVLWESKLDSLLPAASDTQRLEASGVAVHDGHFVLIFDSMDHVARIAVMLTHAEASHWVRNETMPSGYEDIAYNPREGQFYFLIEALPTAGGGFHSAIVEHDRDFVPQAHHPLPF